MVPRTDRFVIVPDMNTFISVRTQFIRERQALVSTVPDFYWILTAEA